jgi:hypothetical protein
MSDDKLKAVADLRGYDHCFMTKEGVEDFATRFGLAGKIKPYVVKANPNDPKGLTLDNGATSAIGMDAAILASVICDHLGVKYMSKMGRGFQLRACCDALETHFTPTAADSLAGHHPDQSGAERKRRGS